MMSDITGSTCAPRRSFKRKCLQSGSQHNRELYLHAAFLPSTEDGNPAPAIKYSTHIISGPPHMSEPVVYPLSANKLLTAEAD